MAGLKINPEDLEITHTKGSGPGGQNRNKRMTGIRLKHLPTGLVVMATERRSQEQNLQAAFERMEEKLERHFYVQPRRVKTKKTRGSQVRRVEEKKHRSSHKQMRRRVSSDES
jgi:ribosome-associated protein